MKVEISKSLQEIIKKISDDTDTSKTLQDHMKNIEKKQASRVEYYFKTMIERLECSN